MRTTITTCNVVNQSIYVRIPALIVKSPAFEPSKEYQITIDANSTITLTPITKSRSPNTQRVMA